MDNLENILTKVEMKILRRYKEHLFKVAGLKLSERAVLCRIIKECNEELDIVESDLKFEEKQNGNI